MNSTQAEQIPCSTHTQVPKGGTSPLPPPAHVLFSCVFQGGGPPDSSPHSTGAAKPDRNTPHNTTGAACLFQQKSSSAHAKNSCRDTAAQNTRPVLPSPLPPYPPRAPVEAASAITRRPSLRRLNPKNMNLSSARNLLHALHLLPTSSLRR